MSFFFIKNKQAKNNIVNEDANEMDGEANELEGEAKEMEDEEKLDRQGSVKGIWRGHLV